ncbi:MAG TPA: radical SAM protein [Longimicrobium sp.]|jgi:MoaA/NifB/PqqE/SkfB family radical SAM enzyme
MLVGIAITEHCNLRCAHCIRDDVTTVRNLDVGLIHSIAEQGGALWTDVEIHMTGGEPTIHPGWDRIIAGLHERGVRYSFTSNGWHMRRLIPGLDRSPPERVRLSLSGGDEAVHDAERGRGSFRRILLAIAMLTSRGIPTSLGFVVDRRDRHQLRQAADLAEALGCTAISFVLAQPVGGSAARDTDLAPHEWYAVRDEIIALGREARRTRVRLDYGSPAVGEEMVCDSFERKRVYVDARGRLSICCQLSEYGFNDADVVADLHEISLAEVWPRYVAALELQRIAAAPRGDGGELDAFPCIRCARSMGKMQWLRAYPQSPWAPAAEPGLRPVPRSIVSLTYARRNRVSDALSSPVAVVGA